MTCRDGRSVAEEYVSRSDAFVYLDPPYVQKGASLYPAVFDTERHRALAETLKRSGSGTWMLTYDDTELIRTLYRENPGGLFPLRYSAASWQEANELMIFSNTLAAAAERYPCAYINRQRRTGKGHQHTAWNDTDPQLRKRMSQCKEETDEVHRYNAC